MNLEVGMEGKEYKRDLLCEMLRYEDTRSRLYPTRGGRLISAEKKDGTCRDKRDKDWGVWLSQLARGIEHHVANLRWMRTKNPGGSGMGVIRMARERALQDQEMIDVTLEITRCAYGFGEGTEDVVREATPAGPIARMMAEEIIQKSEYNLMPVLADCLEDSLEGGSAAPPKMVLDHLRSGRHGPCCWVLRWVLGVARWREVCGGSKR